MKRICLIMILCMIVALAGPVAAKTTFIGIGTGGTGGIYYPYGGGVAEIVGQKLRTLGSDRQVLCVTHLAQVAAHNDQAVGRRRTRDSVV